MFIRHVFQTTEVGAVVLFRLTKEHGGIGDITVTSTGVVITGSFDLNSPELQEMFAQTYKQARALVEPLRILAQTRRETGETTQDPRVAVDSWFNSGKGAQGGENTGVRKLEQYSPSTLIRILDLNAPLSLGLRQLSLTGDFSTTVSKCDSKGVWRTYCALCLEPLPPTAAGLLFPGNHVDGVGIFNVREQRDAHNTRNMPLVVDSRETGRPCKLSDKLEERDVWVHSCAPVGSVSVRTVFAIPYLETRK